MFYITIPMTKQFGPYGGRYLLSVLINEPEAISRFTKLNQFQKEIAALLDATDHPRTALYCPVCHSNEVSYFLLPDLNNFSPCFRRTCCDSEKCKQETLKTFVGKEEDFRSFSLRTVLSFTDEWERRSICKFFREVLKLPKGLGGVELIHWCKDVFLPVEVEV